MNLITTLGQNMRADSEKQEGRLDVRRAPRLHLTLSEGKSLRLQPVSLCFVNNVFNHPNYDTFLLNSFSKCDKTLVRASAGVAGEALIDFKASLSKKPNFPFKLAQSSCATFDIHSKSSKCNIPFCQLFLAQPFMLIAMKCDMKNQ